MQKQRSNPGSDVAAQKAITGNSEAGAAAKKASAALVTLAEKMERAKPKWICPICRSPYCPISQHPGIWGA